MSEPALVRVPLEAWLCLFLMAREGVGWGCWRTLGGVFSLGAAMRSLGSSLGMEP